jgi:hypothetical protein
LARRVEFEAAVDVSDDDEPDSRPSEHFDVTGFCEVSLFDREVTGVAIPAGRNPVMCAGGEAKVEITASCRLLGDNMTVEVDLHVDFFEGDSCSDNDRDDSFHEILTIDPCSSEEPLACAFRNRSISLNNEDGSELFDDSRASVELTMFNHQGTVIDELPDVRPENMRQVNFGGEVRITDDETWPAGDEHATFVFAGDCIVDPFSREDDFEYTRCGGAEARVDVTVTCRLGLDNTSVNVEVRATLFEGTTCGNDDNDGVRTREELISACGSGCSATELEFTVRNDDEGGDSATLDLTATNVQR